MFFFQKKDYDILQYNKGEPKMVRGQILRLGNPAFVFYDRHAATEYNSFLSTTGGPRYI
jgi:hypothetical protein